MWLLRVGTRGRWCRDGKPHDRLDPSIQDELERCTRDLTPREQDDGKLSMYRVESEDEAVTVAEEWAMEKRELDDDHLDYVLLPDSCFVPGEVAAVQDTDGSAKHHLLRERHYLVHETHEGGFRTLASRALRHDELKIERILRKDLKALRASREG